MVRIQKLAETFNAPTSIIRTSQRIKSSQRAEMQRNISKLNSYRNKPFPVMKGSWGHVERKSEPAIKGQNQSNVNKLLRGAWWLA